MGTALARRTGSEQGFGRVARSRGDRRGHDPAALIDATRRQLGSPDVDCQQVLADPRPATDIGILLGDRRRLYGRRHDGEPSVRGNTAGSLAGGCVTLARATSDQEPRRTTPAPTEREKPQ
jgi:hypothetical protein